MSPQSSQALRPHSISQRNQFPVLQKQHPNTGHRTVKVRGQEEIMHRFPSANSAHCNNRRTKNFQSLRRLTSDDGNTCSACTSGCSRCHCIRGQTRRNAPARTTLVTQQPEKSRTPCDTQEPSPLDHHHLLQPYRPKPQVVEDDASVNPFAVRRKPCLTCSDLRSISPNLARELLEVVKKLHHRQRVHMSCRGG